MSIWDLDYKGTSIIDLYLTLITDLYGTLINADRSIAAPLSEGEAEHLQTTVYALCNSVGIEKIYT